MCLEVAFYVFFCVLSCFQVVFCLLFAALQCRSLDFFLCCSLLHFVCCVVYCVCTQCLWVLFSCLLFFLGSDFFLPNFKIVFLCLYLKFVHCV